MFSNQPRKIYRRNQLIEVICCFWVRCVDVRNLRVCSLVDEIIQKEYNYYTRSSGKDDNQNVCLCLDRLCDQIKADNTEHNTSGKA